MLTPSRRQNARVTRSSNRMMPSPRSGFEWTPRDMLASLSEGSLHRTWRARERGVNVGCTEGKRVMVAWALGAFGSEQRGSKQTGSQSGHIEGGYGKKGRDCDTNCKFTNTNW